METKTKFAIGFIAAIAGIALLLQLVWKFYPSSKPDNQFHLELPDFNTIENNLFGDYSAVINTNQATTTQIQPSSAAQAVLQFSATQTLPVGIQPTIVPNGDHWLVGWLHDQVYSVQQFDSNWQNLSEPVDIAINLPLVNATLQQPRLLAVDNTVLWLGLRQHDSELAPYIKLISLTDLSIQTEFEVTGLSGSDWSDLRVTTDGNTIWCGATTAMNTISLVSLNTQGHVLTARQLTNIGKLVALYEEPSAAVVAISQAQGRLWLTKEHDQFQLDLGNNDITVDDFSRFGNYIIVLGRFSASSTNQLWVYDQNFAQQYTSIATPVQMLYPQLTVHDQELLVSYNTTTTQLAGANSVTRYQAFVDTYAMVGSAQ